MTKAEIVTQVRIWIKENDSTSEVIDSQIYSLVDSAMYLWLTKVMSWCGMTGFRDFEEESLTVDSDGKSKEYDSTALVTGTASGIVNLAAKTLTDAAKTFTTNVVVGDYVVIAGVFYKITIVAATVLTLSTAPASATYSYTVNKQFTPFLIVEAAMDFGSGYKSMKRREGMYEEDDNRTVLSSTARPTYRLLATSTPGWKLEISPRQSGTAKVRFMADPGAFASADATNPTDMVTLAENGLACYTAGIYYENQANGKTDADRCYAKADEFLKMMPRGFRGR